MNTNPVSKAINFNVSGNGKLAKKANVTTLSSSDLQAENTVDQPEKIAPEIKQIKISGKTFAYDAKPLRMNVIRIKRI